MLISIISLGITVNETSLAHAQTNVATTAEITVNPNSVNAGQQTEVFLQITPAPPSATDSFNQVVFMELRPNGIATNYTESFNPGSAEYNFSFQNSASGGTFVMTVFFLGQSFENGTVYYLPSENQTTFTIIPSPSPSPSPSPMSVTINADGSVSPSAAPILRAGNVYALTSDLSGTIMISANNLIINGEGHTVNVPPLFGYGITLNSVSNVTIANFSISGGAIGITVTGTSNTIANNNISGTDNGIYSLDEPTSAIALNDASQNKIIGNTLASNTVGLALTSWNSGKCNSNQIIGNSFTDSSTALLLYDSSNNTIYHNDFINNKVILEDTGYIAYGLASLNTWDDGYLGGGNYWSDYQARYPNAQMINGTGIGDTPYFVTPQGYIYPSGMSSSASDYWNKLNAIESKNIDHYPLMEIYNQFSKIAKTPPKISISSPLSIRYNESSVPLVFSVDNDVNWTGYSLDGKQNITLTGNTGNITIANLVNGKHSVTVYANSTFGSFALQQVSFIIAKPESSANDVFIPVSITAVVVVVVLGLLVYFKSFKRSK